jgi:hypothetical protein
LLVAGSNKYFDPAPSSLFRIISNSQGLLVPRMTSAERDLIIALLGLLIYNYRGTSNFNYFDIEWKIFCFAINYNSNLVILQLPNIK